MDGKSLDIVQDNIDKLKQLFPSVFSEGKINLDRLKQELGDDLYTANEHYELSWAGKNETRQEIQKRTTATLVLDKEGSINFDEAKNIFIEGENLEVLRVLQQSYFGKIKMIYIDPPYNTGSDSFVYPDDYSERRDEYLKRTGAIDEEGFLNKQDLWKKNTKENGQYHSAWLSMMYPRLYIARNLLREDGVIFISIDDNEQANLKLLCDEIFGEDNFEGSIHWRRRHNQPNDKTKMLGLVAEHILCYSKNKTKYKETGVGKIDITGSFSNPDNDIRGDWASKPWKVGSDQSGSRYIIKTPTGKILDEEWMGDENTYKSLRNDNKIYFPKKGDGFPRKKYFKYEREKEGQSATNWWSHEDFGHNQLGTDEMTNLFSIKNIFNNPKPTKLIKGLIQISNAKNNDLILDFFAGSGTTAQAVLDQNEYDGGNRRFICVQMPELLEEKSEAYQTGKYRTIADICKERIRRSIAQLENKREGTIDFEKKQKLAFAAYKLQPSNFKIWQSDADKIDLKQQLLDFTQSEKAESLPQNMLIELLLKTEKEALIIPYTFDKEFYKT